MELEKWQKGNLIQGRIELGKELTIRIEKRLDINLGDLQKILPDLKEMVVKKVVELESEFENI